MNSAISTLSSGSFCVSASDHYLSPSVNDPSAFDCYFAFLSRKWVFIPGQYEYLCIQWNKLDGTSDNHASHKTTIMLQLFLLSLSKIKGI